MSSAVKMEILDNNISGEQQTSILLIDEQRITAEIERNYFISIGFKAFIATSRDEIESIVQKNFINLVIIDVGLKSGHSFALLALARKFSKNKDIKILATSIIETPKIRLGLETHKIDLFILKPAPRTSVLKKIKKLTSQPSRDTERVKEEVNVEWSYLRKVHSTKSVDISSEGIHIEWKDQASLPPLGAEINVNLIFNLEKKPIKVKGTVMRHTSPGFGVKFAELETSAKRSLDKILMNWSIESKATPYYL